LISDFKQRIDAGMRSMMCGAIAAVASIVALCFFCVAAFDWLSQIHGPIAAGLLLGGFFVLVAIVTLGVAAILRRNAQARRRVATAKAKAQWWLDPTIMATGIQIGKALGPRRLVSLTLVGAFIAGLLLSRPAGPSGSEDDA